MHMNLVNTYALMLKYVVDGLFTPKSLNIQFFSNMWYFLPQNKMPQNQPLFCLLRTATTLKSGHYDKSGTQIFRILNSPASKFCCHI